MGMDAETLGKAKEPFFTTKGVGKGTGLGLSQVHGLLEQMGGKFILKSTLGVGTIAEFWIPAIDPRDLSATVMEAPEVTSMEKMPQLRILVVDDDALVLMNTVAMLEDMGHLVRDAGSAKEALDILKQEPPFDLVVTDMSMPQMNGLEFAQLVRADWPNLPILLATGYAELPEGRALNLPILGKPFGQGSLTKAIDMVFGRPSQPQEADV
jgi:CheY-like chemotaxis protein